MSVIKKLKLGYLITAAVFTGVGLGLDKTDLGGDLASQVKAKASSVNTRALETVVKTS